MDARRAHHYNERVRQRPCNLTCSDCILFPLNRHVEVLTKEAKLNRLYIIVIYMFTDITIARVKVNLPLQHCDNAGKLHLS